MIKVYVIRYVIASFLFVANLEEINDPFSVAANRFTNINVVKIPLYSRGPERI